jgi:hypothetical protein
MIKYNFMLKIINMVTVRKFEGISDIINAVGICRLLLDAFSEV